MNNKIAIPTLRDFTALLEYRPGDNPRAPRLTTVFAQQFKLMDLSQLYPMLMLLLAGGAVFSMGIDFFRYPYNVLPLPLVLLASVAWASMVWRSEPPSRRAYHRTMPIDATVHDMVKIGAGAIALAAGVSLVLLVLCIAAVIAGVAPRFAFSMPIVWFNFVISSLIAYLFTSCVPLLTDKPLEWMVGIAASFAFLRYFMEQFEIGPVEDFMFLVFSSEVGLATTLRGFMGSAVWEYTLEHEPLITAPLLPYGGALAGVVLSFFWFGVAAGTVYFASRHANRRPA